MDSLRKVLLTEKEDTNKIKTLNILCDKLLYNYVIDSSNNKEAMQWAE